MITQLPPDTLGLSSNKSSPLGLYLKEALGVRSKVSEAGSPSFIMGALTAAMQPFDPMEVVTREFSEPERSLRGSGHLTLLEAALQMGFAENAWAPKRNWPSDLASFNANLRERHEGPRSQLRFRGDTINGEWLGAVLVAAGCNPWLTVGDMLRPAKPKDGDLPSAVAQMIRLGYAGLLERSLDIPGAWPAQMVWDSKATVTDSVAKIAVKADSTNTLELLLERGARPRNEAELARLLVVATLEAVEVLGNHMDLSLGPKAAQEVVDAWTERRKRQEISSEDLALISSLMHKGTDVDQAYVDIKTSELLASPWGKRPNGSQASAYDFMRDHEPEVLTARQHKKGGPSAGEWSLLAAAAFARIRQAAHEGALGWSVHYMVQQERALDGSIPPNDFNAPPLKGCLKDAIGFDWRPGIPIDGVVALSLFGQRAEAHTRSAMGNSELEKLDKDWLDFGRATGIVDKNGWAVRHAQAAADFTLAVLKNPSAAQARAMLSTWDTAISRNPEMAQAIDLDTAADLLQALSANFRTQGLKPYEFQERIDRVSLALFPDLFSQGTPKNVDTSLKGAELKAHLVMFLNGSDDATLKAVDGNFQDFPFEHADLVEHRLKAIKDKDASKKALIGFNAWKMDHVLPAASSRGPGPGKRL